MDSYYTLITSLPHLGEQLDDCAELPITRLGLDNRLSMLPEKDQDQLQHIRSLYFTGFDAWFEQADSEIAYHWNEGVSSVESKVIKERLQFHYELQTLIAAYRYRELGQGSAEHFSGSGRWVGFIKRHWHDPDFAIGEFHPAWKKLIQALSQGKVNQVDAELNELLWRDLSLQQSVSGFYFEALVCYVLRWEMVANQLARSADSSVERFNQLAEKLLESTELKGVGT